MFRIAQILYEQFFAVKPIMMQQLFYDHRVYKKLKDFVPKGYFEKIYSRLLLSVGDVMEDEQFQRAIHTALDKAYEQAYEQYVIQGKKDWRVVPLQFMVFFDELVDNIIKSHERVERFSGRTSA